ncbi:MAG: hypothetical protein Q7S95_02215 [bacterium]|nr:hypothetical protein [bacterium]
MKAIVEQKQKTIIIATIVIFLLAGGVGFWLWSENGRQGIPSWFSDSTARELSPAEIEESLGSQIVEQTNNPLKGKLPPTNPFEETETNPLKDVYQNPF